MSGNLKEERVRAWQTFAKRHPEGALFCFRGGLRSEIAQRGSACGSGFSPIKGGYKAMRRWLIDTSDNLISNGHFCGRRAHWRGKNRLLNEGNAGNRFPAALISRDWPITAALHLVGGLLSSRHKSVLSWHLGRS